MQTMGLWKPAIYFSRHGELDSKPLLIYTSRSYRATMSFICSHVGVQLRNRVHRKKGRRLRATWTVHSERSCNGDRERKRQTESGCNRAGGWEGEGRGQTARGQLLIRTTPSCPCRTDWSKARGCDEACRQTPISFQLPHTAAAQIFVIFLHVGHPLKWTVDVGKKAWIFSDFFKEPKCDIKDEENIISNLEDFNEQ